MALTDLKLAIIGLGYVGLPLAAEFGKNRTVVGFDINQKRISELREGIDNTLELSDAELKSSSQLSFSDDIQDLKDCNCFIVTVPTPIDEHQQPDLYPLIMASQTVASVLNVGDIVIYESTVYPGATEEKCIPVLEEISGLEFNKDFFAGYSPERINPGDKEHRLPNIVKVTSGSNAETLKTVDELYSSIIVAGTYPVKSIQVAEAAKVIENTQRDLNIALINELAIIFNKLNIDTEEVLKAAGTKWNFLPFRPGLVGGHCIGVDPYYLTFKAQSIGYQPEIILSGRRLNNDMGAYVSSVLIKSMLQERIHVQGSKVLIMGLSFKENCPDIRNTKVTDIVHELKEYGANIDCYDPWVKPDQILDQDIILVSEPIERSYDAIILAVAHDQFLEMGIEKIRYLGKGKHLIYDLKYLFDASDTDLRL